MLRKIFAKKSFKTIESIKQEKTLCDACEGEVVRIECLRGEVNDCNRLREMGFCESARVEKILHSSALICKVCETNVIVSEGLAKNIIVGECTEKG
mgnify:CR=1 FL=1